MRSRSLWLRINVGVALLIGGVLVLDLIRYAIVSDIERGKAYSCGASVWQIDAAVEQWAMDHHVPKNGPAPKMSDLVPRYIASTPACPDDGVLTVGKTHQGARCSIHGFPDPEILLAH